jgi:crotonobetainyl-CoA:carnitine CoA-transferase CaiB-like acyl-CoA transferase
VAAALVERARTGRGQVVRTSLLAAIVGAHAFLGTRYTVGGEVPGVIGNFHPQICPYGLYRTADGFVQIAVANDPLWQRFAPVFGLDRPEWALNRDRVRHHDAVNAAVDDAFGARPADEVLATLAGLGIPAGKVRDFAEVYGWDQTRSQGLLIDVEHAALGPVTLPGPSVRLDLGGRTEHLPPPTLNQHGDAIRAWLAEPRAPEPEVIEPGN